MDAKTSPPQSPNRWQRPSPNVTGAKPVTPGAVLLSVREEEILRLVSEGRTNAQIAAILAISCFTVKNHVQRIIKKLGAANRTEAVSKHRGLTRRAAHNRRAGDATRAAAAVAAVSD